MAGARVSLSGFPGMIILIRKNLDLFIVALLAVSLVMYDVTIELFLELLHLGFEVIHNLFEWVELGIEHAVEHLFHTERHGSQIITFYILCSIILFGFWQLWKVLPRLYGSVKSWALETWVRRTTQLQLYWQSLSLLHKVGLGATALVVAYLASFFVI
jgi:hypothetical protein